MLVELSILPVCGDERLSPRLAEVLRVIDASGLPYRLTPAGTCIEGSWDEVMALVKRCHDKARERATRVVTHVKIDDQEGVAGKLTGHVQSVESIVGKRLERVE